MRPQIQITCPRCNCLSLKDRREVTRQTKNNKPVFCSQQCATLHLKEKRTKHITVQVKCVTCGKEFISTTHVKAKKCCSQKCAAQQSQSFVDTLKISVTLKDFYSKNPHPLKGKFFEFKARPGRCQTSPNRSPTGKYHLTCVNCSKPFDHKIKTRKTCSKECQRARNSALCGGETNYRKFKYNDIWMDSSWEVELAMWMDEKSITWKRDKKLNFPWIDSKGVSHRYYPDFYLSDYDLYIDPKNKYLQKKDKEKLDYVRNEHNIHLLSGDLPLIKEEVLKLISGL